MSRPISLADTRKCVHSLDQRIIPGRLVTERNNLIDQMANSPLGVSDHRNKSRIHICYCTKHSRTILDWRECVATGTTHRWSKFNHQTIVDKSTVKCKITSDSRSVTTVVYATLDTIACGWMSPILLMYSNRTFYWKSDHVRKLLNYLTICSLTFSILPRFLMSR